MRVEKKDGYKDGDRMKINKQKLKQIILEELNGVEENKPMSRADLIKKQRATRGTELATQASRLSQTEVTAQDMLNKLGETISAKGNQASPEVLRYLGLALEAAQKGANE